MKRMSDKKLNEFHSPSMNPREQELLQALRLERYYWEAKSEALRKLRQPIYMKELIETLEKEQ